MQQHGIHVERAERRPGRTNEPDFLDAMNTISGDWQAAMIDLSVQRARIGTDIARIGPQAWAETSQRGSRDGHGRRGG